MERPGFVAVRPLNQGDCLRCGDKSRLYKSGAKYGGGTAGALRPNGYVR